MRRQGAQCLIFHPTARCPVFDLYDYKDPANKCLQSPAIDEKTTGTLPALPGCNPVVSDRGRFATFKMCADHGLGYS